MVLLLFVKLLNAQKCNQLFTDIDVYSPVPTPVTNCLSSSNGYITFKYKLGFDPANLSYLISAKNKDTKVRTGFFPTQAALQNIVITNLSAGTYDSFFVQGPAGCIDTFFYPVVIDPPSNLFYTPIPYDVTGCVGSSTGRIEFLFTVTATNFNYSITAFDVDGNSFGPFGRIDNKITITNLPANTYNTFEVLGPNNCLDIINKNIIVAEPDSPLSLDSIRVFNASCGGNGALFIKPLGGKSPYVINTTGDTPSETYSGPSPDNLVGGSYDVDVTDDNGCRVERLDIVLLEGDTFRVQIELDGSNIINLGESVSGMVTLDPLSSGFNPSNFIYEWDNDYRISCVDCPDPVFNPCKDTLYTLIVRDDSAGCIATIEQRIEVVGSFSPFIPNAFTPNGSGPELNEYIRVFGTGIDQVDIVVFDSRGAMVFKGNGFYEDIKWDGTMSGTLLNSGTYLYDAKITSVCDEEIKNRGQILLIR